MTICTECRFYKQTDHKKKFGLCEVKLPAWIDRIEITSRKANIVDAKEGCDIGKPIEDDDEL